MEVTQKLMDEHQLILRYIGHIRTMIDMKPISDKDKDQWFKDLESIVSFIQEYADRYHHAKEEDILFKAMEAPGVMSHCNPLPVMLSDHEIGRTHVRDILHAILTQNYNSAIEHAGAWADHLENHIHKEDNVLYVMAEEGLSDSEKIRVSREYALVEVRLDGTGLEKRYQNILNQLKQG
jgi:hemerythrin-like domain-containing protein